MAEQAGTPTPEPGTSTAQNPEPAKDDSTQVTVSAQFKKEALEHWKPAAEEANKLKAELAAERVKTEQLSRLAYGGQQATDPRIQRIAQFAQQAE